MFETQITKADILSLVTLPFERKIIAQHSVHCIEMAASQATENGAETRADEYTWAASYLDGGDVDCVCR